MRANLLKCDEGRLNSIIMFEKCSKYFRIKLHLFVWQIWERKDNKTCGYKDQSPSEYFGIKLHLFSLTHVWQCDLLIYKLWRFWEKVWIFWDKVFSDPRQYSFSKYFGIKLHLLSLTHVGKKRQYNLLIKNFEWLDIFTTVKNVKDWKLVLWLDWVIGFELWQNLWFQTHYL